MDEQEFPTLEDIGLLLEHSRYEEPCPQLVPVILWLIDQDPGTRDAWQKMNEREGDRPTMLELAKLVYAVQCGTALPECQATARWLIQRAPRARARFETLSQMARDMVHVPPHEWPQSVLLRNAEVDRLLQTTRPWTDPYEVLDPTRHRGLEVGELYQIARGRLERATDERERARLEDVVRKLEVAVENTDPVV